MFQIKMHGGDSSIVL